MIVDSFREQGTSGNHKYERSNYELERGIKMKMLKNILMLFLMLNLATLLHCDKQQVSHPSPQRLSTPGNGSTVSEKQPIFSWTPPTPLPSGQITYSLRIVEILSNQTPSNAMQSNTPWFEQDTTTTSFLYPAVARAFEPDKSYCWNVKAYVNGNLITTSEIWTFFCTVPEEKCEECTYWFDIVSDDCEMIEYDLWHCDKDKKTKKIYWEYKGRKKVPKEEPHKPKSCDYWMRIRQYPEEKKTVYTVLHFEWNEKKKKNTWVKQYEIEISKEFDFGVFEILTTTPSSPKRASDYRTGVYETEKGMVHILYRYDQAQWKIINVWIE